MGKIVFVTGASSGIGLKTAELFLSNGDTVYNGSRRACPLSGVHNISLDVSEPDGIKKAVEKIIIREDRIDTAIYCAGISIAGPLEKSKKSDYEYLYDVNFFGAAEFVKCVVPHMKNSGGGRIILVSSLAGILPIPFESFYSASKAALNALSLNLNLELAPFNIKVTSILPGGTKTAFTRRRKVNYRPGKEYRQNEKNAVEVISQIEQTGMEAESVAEVIFSTTQKKNPEIIRVVGLKNRLTAVAAKLLPQKAIYKILQYRYRQTDSENNSEQLDL